MKNRLCAWFLVMCLLLGVMPPGVRATDVVPLDAAVSEGVAATDTASFDAKEMTIPDTSTPSVDVPDAELFAASGTCGDNLTWTLDNSGTITISGTGPMADYNNSADVSWNEYRQSIDAVIIENGVTTIGSYAFYYCTNLTDVTISNSVASINSRAFYHCEKLSSVTIPGNVISIGEFAFAACALTEVIILDGVTTIESSAFSSCRKLTSVTIPSSVISSDTKAISAFGGSDNLTDVYYNGTRAQWKAIIFSYLDPILNANVHCSDGDIIPTQGYCGNKDESNDESNVTWLLDNHGELTISGSGAMANYSSDSPAPWYNSRADIQQITIGRAGSGNDITTVGDYAFLDCSNATHLWFHDDITRIGNGAFQNCSSLSEGSSFPDSLLSIGDRAFSGCSSLKSVTVSHSITEIGDFAFSDCVSMEDVIITDTVSTIGGGAFAGCSSLKDVYLTSKSVSIIQAGTFQKCSSLASINISENITDIGATAFSETALIDVHYGGTKAQWSELNIGEGNAPLLNATIHCTDGDISGSGSSAGETSSNILAQGECGANGDNLMWVLTSNGTLTISGSGEWEDYNYSSHAPWYENRDSITMVVIENGVTSIGKYTFYDCKNLTSVTIPSSVTVIATSAFEGCSKLTNVTIPNSVTEIGSMAFQYCRDLKSMTIPASVTSMGTYAFSKCSGLKSMTIPDSVTSIKYGMFEDCSNLTSVTIPASVSFIETSAFSGCSALADVYYGATQTQWNDLNIGNYNAPLLNATIHYNSGGNATNITLASVTLNPVSVTLDGTNGASVTATAIGSDNNAFTRGVTWSVTPTDSGVTINATSGTIVIDGSATAQEYTVMATYNNVSQSVMLPVTRNLSLASVTINPSSVVLDGTNSASAQATAYYPSGNVITQENGHVVIKYPVSPNGLTMTWHINPANSGVIIEQNSGLITIASNATAGEYTITAELREEYDFSLAGEPKSATLTVSRNNASDIIAQGYCGAEDDGTNLLWLLTRDGTLTVSGSGKMVDYTFDNGSWTAPWYEYRNNIAIVVMEIGVTSIGNYAFVNHNSLTSVTIPNSVTSIGGQAFYECSRLTSVTIPNSVTSIKDGTFEFCSGLTNVTISDGVTSISDIMFFSCSSLTSVTIPNSVISIGNRAFDNCDALTDVYYSGTKAQWATLKSNIESDNDPLLNAMIHCTDGDIINGQSATTYTVTFDANGGGGSMSAITVTDSAYTLPQCGFDAPSGMRFKAWSVNGAEYAPGATITLSNSVTVTAQWISDEILAQGECGANLTWILTRDGTLTISGSGAMTEYSVSASAPWYAYRQSVKTVIMGSGVSSIGAYAFRQCDSLTNVTIPNSVTSVTPHAFEGCNALESVSYDGTQEQWDNIILNTNNNDPLEFAEVTCGDAVYNAFRALNSLGKMDEFSDQTWRFAVPLSKFRNLYIDVEDVKSAQGNTEQFPPLDRKSSLDDLTRAKDSKEYAATSGSTVLTIPKETFDAFHEGSHNITATFETTPNPRKADDTGFHKTSEVYTIFPKEIGVDDSEIMGENAAKAVQDVSYTARLQTAPRLSDDFYRFEIISAKLNGEEQTLTEETDSEQTENETANTVQRLGEQGFFFHPNGRFSGVPSKAGDYEFTVRLQVRKELKGEGSEWYNPLDTESFTLKIHVEEKTAENIRFTSPGYELIKEPPSVLEYGNTFQIISKAPFEEFVAFWLDDQKLEEGKDYIASPYPVNNATLSQLLDGGAITQLFIELKKNGH